jgi:hypothetical protein
MPPQNIFIPPPVPVLSITGVLKPEPCPNLSATIVANGYTVELPTIEICSLACAIVDVARIAAIAAIIIFRIVHTPVFYA